MDVAGETTAGEPVSAVSPGHLFGQADAAGMVDDVSEVGAPTRRSPILAGFATLRLHLASRCGNKASRRLDRESIDVVSTSVVDALFGSEFLDRLGFFGRRRARMAQDRRSAAPEGYRSNA